MSLEDDYKEIFLDIACILKGEQKEEAIRILECCGFHARNGLKVLEQRYLINFSSRYDGKLVLGMHDHIEEMGKNIVRCEHPDEPNKHSRQWINEEIEDILANDKGTGATRCLKLNKSRGNLGIVMKGLGKMKKLRYLDAKCLDDTNHYFPNSLKYLRCWDYPFLYLPKTFPANNLVGLEINRSRIVQLWEDGEKKVLTKLKFLSLRAGEMTTFDFGMTPNLETLSLMHSSNLKELCMPDTCQKLKHLNMSYSMFRTFDLGLTPNLETLSFDECDDFVELHESVACLNLKTLKIHRSRLRSLDLDHDLIPNLESLDLQECHELVEINAPFGCLKKVGYLNLGGCLRFTHFEFGGRYEPKVNCSLYLSAESLHICQLHPTSNLPKLRFHCYYEEYLAPSIGNIEKLISFGLCACTDLKIFSDMICSLRCLRKLKLKGSIPEFPKDLGQLECLEELHLSSTKIKHLPDSICTLKRLKSLEVTYSDLLEKLPEDLGHLECLEKLYVSSKKIEYLPDSICKLKGLKSLDVTKCCHLGKLPEDIDQLENLETLALSATKITHLPDSICMLKRLKSLEVNYGYLFEELSDNLLEKLPEDLGKLECLEKLHVTSKKIEYLPDSICMLKRLNSLDVASCSLLGKLPEDIGHLESLERLVLRGTKIKHLPDSICKLKHLKFLNLSLCNLLEKLPENLGRLGCLEKLDIISTGISDLPKSIYGLKDLDVAASPELLQKCLLFPQR